MKWTRVAFAVGVVTAAVIGCTSSDLDPGAQSGGGTCPCVVGNSGIQTTIGCGGRGCISLNGTTKGIFCDATGQHDDPTACTTGGGGTLPDSGSGFEAGTTKPFDVFEPCKATLSGQIAIAAFDCQIGFTNNSGFVAKPGGAIVLFDSPGNAPMQIDAPGFSLHDSTAPFAAGTYTAATGSGQLRILGSFDGGIQEWAMQPSGAGATPGAAYTVTITSVADNAFGDDQYYIAHGTADFMFPCGSNSLDECTASETLHLEF